VRPGVSHSGSKSVDDSLDVTKKSLQRGNSRALNLHLLRPADWPVLRAARLGALLDSPRAFTSQYARESGWGELEWRRMFSAATWVVAHEADQVIGLARSVAEPSQPWIRHVESAWVAPTHRRCGVFRALLHTLAETERRMGVTDLMLWVLEDNFDAQRAYDALGFEPTGERQFLPAFGRFERRLMLVLDRLQDSEPTSRLFRVDYDSAEVGPRPGLQPAVQPEESDVPAGKVLGLSPGRDHRIAAANLPQAY
jgi:ribosomal protein S18 acetylase RimI-like enzyme